MEKINLNLGIDEINTIMNALSEQPFKKVFNLINEIQLQASQQMKPKDDETKE